MGARGIVVLLLLVAGLGAVLLFTDEKPPVTKVATTAVLGGRSLADCVTMRWQFHEEQPIEIGRAPDGRFQLREPLVDIASAARLHQLVVAWDSAQMRAAPLEDTEAGRQQAGLAPPELVFTASWADGDPLTVEVGAPGPLGTTRFLRRDGKIWEGGDALLESLRIGLDDLRERAVFHNAFAHVQEVRVEQRPPGGKAETIHVRLDGAEWRLLAPIEARADAVEAQRFVTAVLSLRVDDFQVGMMAPRQTEPEIEVTVKGGHGEEHLKLWRELGQMFGELPGRGVVFVADQVQYAHVFENAADRLRARMLVPMGESTFAEMVELVVDPGQGRGDRLRLVRDTPAAEWRIVEPVQYRAAPTPSNEAVHAVQLLVASEFVEDADSERPRSEDPRYGLQPAQRTTVTIRGVRDTAPKTLWFGSDASRGDEAFVHTARADEPDTVVLVQKAHVTTLRRSWLAYCDLQIVRQPAGVDQLALVHRDGRERTFRIEDGTWQLAGTPGERDEVGGLVTDLLVDLTGTKAVDARGAGFETPDWTLRLMRKNGDVLDTLRVWDRGAEQALLVQRHQNGGAPPVAFEIGKLVATQLRALWQ